MQPARFVHSVIGDLIMCSMFNEKRKNVVDAAS